MSGGGTLKKRRSEVWNFFTIVDTVNAKCDFCKQNISYKTSTSNLKKHIERNHPTIIVNQSPQTRAKEPALPVVDREIGNISVEEEVSVAINQNSSVEDHCYISTSTFKEATGSTTSSTVSKPNLKIQTSMKGFILSKLTNCQKQKTNDALMKLFTVDMQPFSVVEDEGFREFVEALNPSYDIPSRKTIANSMLPILYEKCHHAAKDALKKASYVCLTTDCWTSSTTDSYIAVTAHFISDKFEMRSALLECNVMNINHSSENLASELSKIVRFWDLENRILLVVSDNAANIKKAIHDGLKCNFYGCFAHKLNLIVNNSLDSVDDLLCRIRQIVGHFKRSATSKAKFIEFQTKDEVQPKRLLQDVSTRWNSTYLMLQRFCDMEKYVKMSIAVLDKEIPVLSQNDWKLAKELCMILKPFFTTTESISGEDYATASLVIVLSDGLYQICLKLKNKLLSFEASQVVSKLEKGVVERLGSVGQNTTLSTAMFLDPRFKSCFQDRELAEHTKAEVVKLVTQKIKAANRRLGVGVSPDVPAGSCNNKDNEITEDDEDQELSPWATVDKCLSNVPKANETARSNVEVRRYLEEPSLERKRDPLEWWRKNSYNYPYLSQVFKDRFCCLATSVPCERLFSKSGYILNDRRTRLSHNKVKQIMFINTNIKFLSSGCENTRR